MSRDITERIRRLEASHRAVIRGLCTLLRSGAINLQGRGFCEKLARELDKEYDKFNNYRTE